MRKTRKKTVQEIVELTAAKFPSFGGEKVADRNNPVAFAFEGSPLVFAGGVNIKEVVLFILLEAKK